MKKVILLLLCASLVGIHCTKDGARMAASETTGQGGSLARFTIVGNYLYSVDDEKLHVFDIRIPNEPVLKNSIQVGFEIETIFPFQDRLFIGSTTRIHIFSLADPAKPEKLSTAISPEVLRRCDPVVAKENVAYATLRTNGPCGGTQSILAVYDIRDIANPISVKSIPVNEPYGLGYSGDALYVCDKNQLRVFDISDAFDPKPIAVNISDGTYIDVIPYGNTLICWVEKGIILYDITDNHKPEFITAIE